MGEGYFDDRVVQNRGGDIRLSNVLAYEDVPFDKFNARLSQLLSDSSLALDAS